MSTHRGDGTNWSLQRISRVSKLASVATAVFCAVALLTGVSPAPLLPVTKPSPLPFTLTERNKHTNSQQQFRSWANAQDIVRRAGCRNVTRKYNECRIVVSEDVTWSELEQLMDHWRAAEHPINRPGYTQTRMIYRGNSGVSVTPDKSADRRQKAVHDRFADFAGGIVTRTVPALVEPVRGPRHRMRVEFNGVEIPALVAVFDVWRATAKPGQEVRLTTTEPNAEWRTATTPYSSAPYTFVNVLHTAGPVDEAVKVALLELLNLDPSWTIGNSTAPGMKLTLTTLTPASRRSLELAPGLPQHEHVHIAGSFSEVALLARYLEKLSGTASANDLSLAVKDKLHVFTGSPTPGSEPSKRPASDR